MCSFLGPQLSFGAKAGNVLNCEQSRANQRPDNARDLTGIVGQSARVDLVSWDPRDIIFFLFLRLTSLSLLQLSARIPSTANTQDDGHGHVVAWRRRRLRVQRALAGPACDAALLQS